MTFGSKVYYVLIGYGAARVLDLLLQRPHVLDVFSELLN